MLSKAIDDLIEGKLAVDRANGAKGLANAISTSIFAEVEVGKLQLQLNRDVAFFGSLDIGKVAEAEDPL